MSAPNRLQRSLQPLDRLPAFLQTWARSRAIGRAVPFVGTAGIRVDELSLERAVFSLAPRRAVQNHIGGVHAAATALLAETATGLAFGMHVRDDAVPLLKSMQVDYRKVATGGLRAEAHVAAEDRARIAAEPKGDVQVHVTITDEAGVQTVDCRFVWAWVPKQRKG